MCLDISGYIKTIFQVLFLLGDINEEKQKRAQTLNVEREDDNADDGGDGDKEEKEADAFQHVKQAKKDDLQVCIVFLKRRKHTHSQNIEKDTPTEHKDLALMNYENNQLFR